MHKPTISKRLISPGRSNKDASLSDPSDSSQTSAAAVFIAEPGATAKRFVCRFGARYVSSVSMGIGRLRYPAEPAGLTYWTGVLDTKAAGSSDVLAAISESGENQAGLIGVIGNGYAFTPYV
jgi:hypothetical protein